MSTVAAVQMASGPNVEGNLLEAERLLGEARAAGAQLAVLPENFAFMGSSERDKLAIAEADGEGPIQTFLAEQARRQGLWIVGGTVPLAADAQHVSAASLVYDARGRRVARYDKIHLFDVELPGSGERYTESDTIRPGREVVVVDSPVGRLGIAVCYDLRFPELFRQMLDQGVEVLAVPSAFTALTGRAHWETLLRARAIENLSYVIAGAQGGYHVNGRETYGHSTIVDPWGVVLGMLERGAGVVTASLDLNRLAQTRQRFPAIAHRRLRCESAAGAPN